MMYFSNSILGNLSDAEEVVHDAFLIISHLDRLMEYEVPKLRLYTKLLVKAKTDRLNQKKNGEKGMLSELGEVIYGSSNEGITNEEQDP